MKSKMKKNMKYKKIAGVLVGLIIIAYLLPPFAFCKGGILLGKRTEDSVNQANHINYPEHLLDNPHYHSTTNFKKFYFVNLRFWERLDITETEYWKQIEQPRIDTFTPFVYAVEQNRVGEMLNSFWVERNSRYWYFDYRYAPF